MGPGGSRQRTTSNETTVRALWLAHREGRIAEMLAFVHPEVVWWPMSRPGLSRYYGHDGVVRLLEDARAANGNFWIELDEITEVEHNLLLAIGRIVALDDRDALARAAVEFHITMKDGLVHRVETVPGAGA